MRLKGDNALMSSAPESRDQQNLSLILQKIEVSKVYKPRFGQAREIALDEFRMLYRNDPFYSWFGLNNLFVYAAHKAAGDDFPLPPNRPRDRVATNRVRALFTSVRSEADRVGPP